MIFERDILDQDRVLGTKLGFWISQIVFFGVPTHRSIWGYMPCIAFFGNADANLQKQSLPLQGTESQPQM